MSAFIFLLTSTGWNSSSPVDLLFPGVLLLVFFFFHVRVVWLDDCDLGEFGFD